MFSVRFLGYLCINTCILFLSSTWLASIDYSCTTIYFLMQNCSYELSFGSEPQWVISTPRYSSCGIALCPTQTPCLLCRYEQYVEDAYVEYLKQHNRPDEVSC